MPFLAFLQAELERSDARLQWGSPSCGDTFMDMRFLKSFLTVAEVSSMSQAAGILHVSQPALSRQIRLLEDEVGAPLFNRNGRGVTLTPAGLLMRARAEEIMHQMSLARTEVSEIARLPAGTVDIGMTPVIAQEIAAPLITHFAAHHPEVRITIVEGLSGHLCEWLSAGRIGLGILDLHDRMPALHFEPVRTEDLLLIGPGGSNMLTRPVPLEDLPSYPLILTTRQHILRQQIDAMAQQAGLKLNIAYEIDTFNAIRQLVLEGFGYAIAPRQFVEDDVSAGRLSIAPIVRPVFRRTVYLAMSSHCQLSLAVRAASHQMRLLMRQKTGDKA